MKWNVTLAKGNPNGGSDCSETSETIKNFDGVDWEIRECDSFSKLVPEYVRI